MQALNLVAGLLLIGVGLTVAFFPVYWLVVNRPKPPPAPPRPIEIVKLPPDFWLPEKRAARMERYAREEREQRRRNRVYSNGRIGVLFWMFRR
jgi:hypothetical protein